MTAYEREALLQRHKADISSLQDVIAVVDELARHKGARRTADWPGLQVLLAHAMQIAVRTRETAGALAMEAASARIAADEWTEGH